MTVVNTKCLIKLTGYTVVIPCFSTGILRYNKNIHKKWGLVIVLLKKLIYLSTNPQFIYSVT